ncbi:MAG: FAD-binding oxidoreductase [Allomuricauda sp.]|nr:MAG: FAD-binding oxidoreductase [Allomuricauda sp.]
MLDYLVVGLGLAGTCFCEVLERQGKSFKVLSDDSQQASVVAGGLYNPVILKRFTLAWKADEQMVDSLPFYTQMEEKLKVKIDHKLRVFRRFTSIEEQNLWFEAADKPKLDPFLSPKIIEHQNACIDAPFGYGEVNHTGRIDTSQLLEAYSAYLRSNDKLASEKFDHALLKIEKDHIGYKSMKARRIIFAEGFGLKINPYFNYLPLHGTKGELLTIHSRELRENNVIKSSVFVIPLGEDRYRIGATYKWKDKTNIPTDASKQELVEKLQSFLKCDFEVVEHVAGIRPTVTDRRPLVGAHPKHPNLYVLNGLGSRGVLLAPFAAKQLYAYSNSGVKIDEEMDIDRFKGKLV